MNKIESSIKQVDPIKAKILSARALNCCSKIGVTNMFELRDFVSSNDLLNVRNCGHKTILELQDALNRFSFTEDSSNTNKQPCIIPDFCEEIVYGVFDGCILDCNTNVSNLFFNSFPTADVFFEKVLRFPLSAFVETDNEILETIFECWSFIVKILKETNSMLCNRKYHDYLEKELIARINLCINTIEENFDDAKNTLLLSRMSEPIGELLHQKFNSIKDTLSIRSQHVIEREQLTFRNIYPFCSKGVDNFRNIRYCGGKSAKEILSAFSTFHLYMYELVSNPEIHKNLIVSFAFPFVSPDLLDDLYLFKEKNGYYPFFKLLSIYYRSTQNRNDLIWCKANGITQPSITWAELAEEYGLTRERIRQLIGRYKPNDEVLKVLHSLDEINYPFLNNDYVDVESCFKEIKEKEFTSCDYFTQDSFVSMLYFYKKLKSLECGDKTILINKDIYNSFDFNLSIADITKTISSKITEEVVLPINIFITNYVLNSTFNSERIKNILVYIFKTIMDIELDEDSNIVLRQNAIDVEDEFYNIIEERGAPVPFDELCNLLRERYTEMSYATGTLRSFLFNSSRISSIGKTSIYTLNKWNISRLTIRELIREALEKSDKPLHLDAIVDYLYLKGRETTKNSVNSTILSDEKCAYVKFKGGFVGLASRNYESSYIVENTSGIRKTFEERIKDYLEFTDTNHHVPFSSSDEYEASLQRWYKNVITGVLDVTSEQLNILEMEMSKRQQYVMTSSEYAFIQKCEDFKYYVSTEFALPDLRTNSSLYGWFSKARQNIKEFEGKKKEAWNKLVLFLADYGFYFDK